MHREESAMESKLMRQHSYKMIKTVDIPTKQAQLINDVMEMCAVKEDLAKSLLLKYQWNSQQLINDFCGENGQEKLVEQLFASNFHITKPTPKGKFLCPVCFTEQTKYTAAKCGHYLCTECYAEYLSESVKAGPDCVFTICPAGCKLILTDVLFKDCVSKQLYEKYQAYFVKSYIEFNKTTKWCPAPSCKYACEYPSMKQTDVYCECGNDWCFKCLKKAHRPIGCELLV